MQPSDPELDAKFQVLVRDNQSRLWGIARAYGRIDAEDLLQEILLQIWRSLRSFEGRAHIDTWCYRIALNVALTWRRREQQRRAHQPRTGVPPDGVADNKSAHVGAERLQRFADSLEGIDRAVLVMLLDDVSYAEMAEILGTSAGAVRVRIHRLKQKLLTWEPLDT